MNKAVSVEVSQGDYHMKYLVLLTPIAGKQPADFKP